MYVGDQNFGVTQLELEFLARHGVKNVDANHGQALTPRSHPTPPHPTSPHLTVAAAPCRNHPQPKRTTTG